MDDQRLHGLFRRFPARCPVAVVDMLAPDLPVEGIELVVMFRDRGRCLSFPRDDHDQAGDPCTALDRIRVSAVTWLITRGHARQRPTIAWRPTGRRLTRWNRDASLT